jgi:hypothetical protein
MAAEQIGSTVLIENAGAGMNLLQDLWSDIAARDAISSQLPPQAR